MHAHTGAPPRVLHLISSLRVGGAERLLVSTLKAARGNARADFVVVIMNDEIDPGFARELDETGFPVYRLGRREGHRSPKYLGQILSILRRHRINVLHTHNDGSRHWGMLARLIMPRLRLVYTVHAEGIGQQISGWKRAAYLWLVDATVAISRFVEAECTAIGARNVALIENGIDLSAFRAAAPPAPWAGLPRLINVARYAPIKGQDILIRALRTCHDRGVPMSLTLVGAKSDPAFHDELFALVAELGLQGHVHFDIGRTDIATVLHEADVFVLPSRKEGFGLVLVEAMAAGLPVVAARTGGVTDLVTNGINGVTFAPENPDDLATQLIALATDPARAAAYARDAALTADRYDISRTLAQHLALYDRLSG